MEPQPYSRLARILHWVTALLVIVQIALGFASDWTEGGLSDALLDQHVRIGLLVFAVVLLRWSWRLAVPPPPLPQSVPKWQKQAAEATHRLLYLLLLAMPLTGYVLWAWTGPTLDWWGIGEVPIVFRGSEDEFWRSFAGYAHEYGAYILTAAVALHVAGALHHELVAGDGLIRTRMGFGRRIQEPQSFGSADGP